MFALIARASTINTSNEREGSVGDVDKSLFNPGGVVPKKKQKQNTEKKKGATVTVCTENVAGSWIQLVQQQVVIAQNVQVFVNAYIIYQLVACVCTPRSIAELLDLHTHHEMSHEPPMCCII